MTNRGILINSCLHVVNIQSPHLDSFVVGIRANRNYFAKPANRLDAFAERGKIFFRLHIRELRLEAFEVPERVIINDAHQAVKFLN